MQRIIAVLLLGLFSSVAWAGCEGLAEKLNAELYVDQDGTVKELRFSNCKVWPYDPSKTIVALVHFQEGSSFATPPDQTDGLYDLTVLLVKSDSGEILNHLFLKGAFSSDAIHFNGITIDTAPYNLAKNVRAFGVRAGFANSSALNSIEFVQMNLYVVRERSLKQVLGGLVVSKKLNERGDGDCTDSATVTNRTLAIADAATLGYADLRLSEKTAEIRSKKEDKGCRDTEKVFSRNHVLRFNGDEYVVPVGLKTDTGN